MSLDIFSVKLIPYPTDIHPYDLEKPEEIVSWLNLEEPPEDGVTVVWISKESADYLNDVVPGSAVPHTMFKFYDIDRYAKEHDISHNGFYIDGDYIVFNTWNDYTGWGEHRVLRTSVPYIPADNNGDESSTHCFVFNSATAGGSYDKSVFIADHADREFYSKVDLPEFLKFCHSNCQNIFDDLADDEVVWMNY